MGATPRIGCQVKVLLSVKFGDNRDYPDIFRIGGIRALPDLKASIIRLVAEIPRELLRTTIENAIMRFQHIIDVSGAHIKHNL
ncbi:uncharacterized protein TNCV_3520741 [Trichonephila clavipes]|nr:uncharacterized protein TNCV_3520741 [Trichonephila clavipes]